MFRNVTATAVLWALTSTNAFAADTLTTLDAPGTESVRARGGFSFNGGGGFGVAGGGTASIAGRVGVQFNRWFSAYYQALPMVFLAGNENGIAAGFVFANSALANFTLGDVVDLGVGPSVDYSAIGGCNAGLDCNAARGVELGLHGRLALNLGGRDPLTGRRSAFSIGVDVHPIFTAAGPFFLATAGIGGEWF